MKNNKCRKTTINASRLGDVILILAWLFLEVVLAYEILAKWPHIDAFKIIILICLAICSNYKIMQLKQKTTPIDERQG